MSSIGLTCAETPLAWPASVDLRDVTECSTCSLVVHAPTAGSLQVLTRRQGSGVGDGVNVEESTSIGADYRGQRYTYEEAILHVPGLHVFPGQTDPYPAEYHIHLRTLREPVRYMTIVIPVSHKFPDNPGSDYFAAIAAQPDPSAVRPTLMTLLPPNHFMITYQGPDLRGRTADVPDPTGVCDSTEERVFLMIVNVAGIRATDLERIPREGSLSTDPRDLPAPGAKPSVTVTRTRLLANVSVAVPGLVATVPTVAGSEEAPGAAKELECKPLRVENGREVVDVNGKPVDIHVLLGEGGTDDVGTVKRASEKAAADKEAEQFYNAVHGLIFFVFILLGLYAADWLFSFVWKWFFLKESTTLGQWEPVKNFIFLGIALTSSGLSQRITAMIGV